ncbi:uncharacterized protein F4812DRAFT_464570 [Daldinia caldariorum]|uniref:uncharacterized protein n=1 Tax=Daldinia caldariorum TaxID=326644 RepID=UPI0020089F84|nr:uncharacterized protein F4812DRAFT_464570 [Daldinia caldariorum]KAI1472457.1 hypothetical protein F4812DRAFT_464570 [Daldinia caldariorum]
MPLGGSSTTVAQQETSKIAVVEDKVATLADLQEQLQVAQHKIETLEKELDSNCDAPEKIVNWLLRERSKLRSSLQRSETNLEVQAERLQQAMKTDQMLFEALEESWKVIEEAIRKEAERTEEVSALREKLRIANNNAADERQLSRFFSQEVEGLLKLIQTQHSEINQHQSAIKNLKRINKVLEEENGNLRAENSSSSADSKKTLPTDT